MFNVNVSLYLQLRKYFDSNQLCQIYLASYPSHVDLFPRSLSLYNAIKQI